MSFYVVYTRMDVHEELLQITEELIRFKTIKGNEAEFAACRAFVKGFFEDAGLHVREYEKDGNISLLFTKSGENPKVLFYGHMDVVTAEDEAFHPKRIGDKLYGRGAMDMKSGVACMMVLMKHFVQKGADVGLLLVADEEVGGPNGSPYVLEQGLRADVVIMPDGGDRVDRIILKEKGVMRLHLTAHGTSAHSSRPWLGDNAFKKLLRTLEAVEALFVPLDEHPEDRWKSTFVAGKVSAGRVINAVPSEAIAECDIRVADPDTPEEILENVEAAIPEDVTLDVLITAAGGVIPEDNEYIQLYSEVLSNTGKILTYAQTHGSSDARYFMAYGIPSIQTQPEGGNLHGKGEWVSMPAIKEYYDVIGEYLEKVA